MPDITVVIPVYKNENSLAQIHEQITEQASIVGYNVEILFVNDASPDNSGTLLRSLADEHANITFVDLDQNVGQQKAVLIGLFYAKGQSVVIMDADLQDPPEAIPLLVGQLNQGYDVVFATRVGRSQSMGRHFTSKIFKTLLHLLTNLPPNAGIFLAMTGDFSIRLTKYHAPRPYIVGMIGASGATISSIPIKRRTRFSGESSYTSLDRLKNGLSAVVWTLIWRFSPKRRTASATSRPTSGESIYMRKPPESELQRVING